MSYQISCRNAKTISNSLAPVSNRFDVPNLRACGPRGPLAASDVSQRISTVGSMLFVGRRCCMLLLFLIYVVRIFFLHV